MVTHAYHVSYVGSINRKIEVRAGLDTTQKIAKVKRLGAWLKW
jgi:hypothetical protein